MSVPFVKLDFEKNLREDRFGNKSWYNHLGGELHREDGPAVITTNTRKWFLYGKELSEELHWKLVKGPVEDLPLYLGLGFDTFIEKRLIK